MKRALSTILTSAVWLITTSCVSPIYNTAEVTKGEKSLYLGAGSSLVTEKYYTYEWKELTSSDTMIALRIDCQPLWGLSDRLALAANIGTAVPIKTCGETVLFGKLLYPSIKIGLQYEFIENPSLALRLDFGSPFPLTFSLLGDIYIPKLNREIATLGLNLSLVGPESINRSTFPLAPTFFINARPVKRFCIYGCATFYPKEYQGWNWYDREEYSLGVGYKVFERL